MLTSSGHSANLDKPESRFVKLNFSYQFGDKHVKASQPAPQLRHRSRKRLLEKQRGFHERLEY